MLQISEDSTLNFLQEYLSSKGWLKKNEEITLISKAGEGNMNVVIRVATNLRSLIVKQSRPFVQKYQHILAPIERIDVEHTFYKAVSNSHMNSYIPRIIGFDANNHILVMEDLGDCDDMSFIYHERSITDNQFNKLITIIHQIHSAKAPNDFPDNIKMRELNHQHIFLLPFMSDNGFSLDDIQPGLQNLSLEYKENEQLKKIINSIGDKYLSKGDTLLHGDYYPGSWMSTDKQLYIIDPEFGFVGFKEFDLGVMAAHLIIATHNLSYIDKIEVSYSTDIENELLRKVTGIEIIRRLIGLAQLPINRTLAEKEELLTMAKNLILS